MEGVYHAARLVHQCGDCACDCEGVSSVGEYLSRMLDATTDTRAARIGGVWDRHSTRQVADLSAPTCDVHVVTGSCNVPRYRALNAPSCPPSVRAEGCQIARHAGAAGRASIPDITCCRRLSGGSLTFDCTVLSRVALRPMANARCLRLILPEMSALYALRRTRGLAMPRLSMMVLSRR